MKAELNAATTAAETAKREAEASNNSISTYEAQIAALNTQLDRARKSGNAGLSEAEKKTQRTGLAVAQDSLDIVTIVTSNYDGQPALDLAPVADRLMRVSLLATDDPVFTCARQNHGNLRTPAIPCSCSLLALAALRQLTAC